MRERETSMAGHHIVLNRVHVLVLLMILFHLYLIYFCSTEVNTVLSHSYIILKSSYLLQF